MSAHTWQYRKKNRTLTHAFADHSMVSMCGKVERADVGWEYSNCFSTVSLCAHCVIKAAAPSKGRRDR